MRKLSKNPWIVTIGSTLLAALFLRLIDWLFIDNLLWDWIKNALGAVGDFFTTEYTVKLYFLILLPILVIAVLVGLLILLSSKKSGNNPISKYPEWKEYNKDVFGDLQYRWQYYFSGNNYEIINLQRLCDSCSCPLVDLKCPSCYEHYGYGHHIKRSEEVEALIIRNIDTGLYKNSRYFNK